jgi:hypothetical protein
VNVCRSWRWRVASQMMDERQVYLVDAESRRTGSRRGASGGGK